MDPHRRALRREAARAFLESLDKLQETLGNSPTHSADTESSKVPANAQQNAAPIPSSPHAPDAIPAPAPAAADPLMESNLFTVHELEQAIADIEQYMQKNTQQ